MSSTASIGNSSCWNGCTPQKYTNERPHREKYTNERPHRGSWEGSVEQTCMDKRLLALPEDSAEASCLRGLIKGRVSDAPSHAPKGKNRELSLRLLMLQWAEEEAAQGLEQIQACYNRSQAQLALRPRWRYY